MFKGLVVFELYDGTWMVGKMTEVSISAHRDGLLGVHCDGYCKFHVIKQGTFEEAREYWKEKDTKLLPLISDR